MPARRASLARGLTVSTCGSPPRSFLILPRRPGIADPSPRGYQYASRATWRFGGVLARKLRLESLQALLLPLQPRIPPPGTFQIVANFHVEPTQPLHLELDA